MQNPPFETREHALAWLASKPSHDQLRAALRAQWVYACPAGPRKLDRLLGAYYTLYRAARASGAIA
jgi:hypothetical protein